MAEILVKAVDASNNDPKKDDWCYKKGYPVSVQPDDFNWGAKECLPDFTLVKIPHVPVSGVRQYTDNLLDDDGVPVGRRMWKIKWNQVPQAIQDRLFVDGELIVKACESYTGSYDILWEDMRDFLENQKTGLLEVGDLPCE